MLGALLVAVAGLFAAGPQGASLADGARAEGTAATRLFALAARAAGWDASEQFARATDVVRDRVLADVYVDRYVRPRYSEAAARAYFEEHRDELKSFPYHRNAIVARLREAAEAAAAQSLAQRWRVHRDLEAMRRPGAVDSTVLARIEDRTVTLRDVKDLAEQRYEARDLERLVEARKEELVDALVLERLCLLEASRTGLAGDPAVRSEIARSEDALLAAQYVASIQSKVTIEEARRYYGDHLDEFKGVDQLRLLQVPASGLEQARAIGARLETGAALDEVSDQGSDLGWVRKGRLHPELEEVAFRLGPNGVSEPVRTPDGWVILQVRERLEGGTKPFRDVAAQILLQLKLQAMEAERRRLLTLYPTNLGVSTFV